MGVGDLCASLGVCACVLTGAGSICEWGVVATMCSLVASNGEQART